MDFNEMIALLRDPGDNVIPPSIYDDLSSAYSDSANLADVSSAKISELEAALAASTDEISRLKQHNYDLLMQTTAATEPVEPDDGNDEETDDDANDKGVDDLFSEDD